MLSLGYWIIINKLKALALVNLYQS